MYRVEMIVKDSVFNDIKDRWASTGRVADGAGEFVFDKCDDAAVSNGVLRVSNGNNIYLYNVADFYRIKIVQINQQDLF